MRIGWRFWFVLALGGGSGALYRGAGGYGALFLGLGLAAAAVLALLVALLCLHGLKAERALSRGTLTAGESLGVHVTVRHISWLPVPWLVLRDCWVPETGGEEQSLAGRMLFPGFRRSVSIRYELDGLPRGVYRFTGVDVLGGDPFGLISIRKRIKCPQTVTVYPRPLAMTDEPFRADSASGDVTSSRSVRLAGVKGSSVRAYAPGDPPHLVDWKTTAKRGRLHSREMEPTISERQHVYLDASASSYAGEAGRQLFECGVRATAGLLWTAAGSGVRAGLTVNGAERLELLADKRPSMTRVFQGLAAVRCDGAGRFAECLLREAGRLSSDTAVIAVTARADRALLESIRQLKRQGRQAFVVLVAADASAAAIENQWGKRFRLLGVGALIVPYTARGEVAFHVREEGA